MMKNLIVNQLAKLLLAFGLVLGCTSAVSAMEVKLDKNEKKLFKTLLKTTEVVSFNNCIGENILIKKVAELCKLCI